MKQITLFLYCLLFSASLGYGEVKTEEGKLLWIGTYTGKILPAEEKLHTMHINGKLLLLKEEGEFLSAREHWAILNKNDIIQREKQLKLSERGLALNLKEVDFTHASEKIKLKDSLDIINEEVSKLKKMSELTGADEFNEEIKLAHENLILEKQLIKERFEQNFSDIKITFEKDKLLLNMENQKKEFRSLKEESHLKAGVSGRISYLIPENFYSLENPKEASIEAGTPTAIIRNDDIVFAVIPKANFESELFPFRSYLARVKTESGMQFTANFHDTITNIENEKIVSYYRFKINEGDVPTAQNSIAEEAVVNILQEFDTPVTIVEKEELIRTKPNMVKLRGWENTVLELFPSKKLAGVGKGRIAIENKD